MTKEERAKKYAETTIDMFYRGQIDEETLRGLVYFAFMRGFVAGEFNVVDLLEAEHTKTIGNYSGVFTEGADIVDWLCAKIRGVK